MHDALCYVVNKIKLVLIFEFSGVQKCALHTSNQIFKAFPSSQSCAFGCRSPPVLIRPHELAQMQIVRFLIRCKSPYFSLDVRGFISLKLKQKNKKGFLLDRPVIRFILSYPVLLQSLHGFLKLFSSHNLWQAIVQSS